jgi:hypothetical protein
MEWLDSRARRAGVRRGWADLGDGRFVHSSSLLHAPLRGVPPAPPSIVSAGHWAMRGDGYDISGVLFTQYFTPDAEAIHLNYWLTDEERGIPRSHGCLGLAYDAAAFAWQFLSLESVVFVHV